MIPENRLNPLYDPEGVDPENKAIRKFMGNIDKFGYSIGAVCGVYELCDHLVCEMSYKLWAAIEQTKEALAEGELAP